TSRKKKGGKDETGKVYECRFCSLKFCKSQALGGHMNRHRQERETETLNRARQLVFSSDNLTPQGVPHLGLRDSNLGATQMIPGNFHRGISMGGGADPSLQFRPVYTRFSSPSILSQAPAPPQHYTYTPPYPPHYLNHPVNDYYMNPAMAGNSHRHPTHINYVPGGSESNYTCIGAPLGRDFRMDHGMAVQRSNEMPVSSSNGEGGGSAQSIQDGF
ncbi:hypothetical protein GIB67_012654, partial [Kingdonia uniflora]